MNENLYFYTMHPCSIVTSCQHLSGYKNIAIIILYFISHTFIYFKCLHMLIF